MAERNILVVASDYEIIRQVRQALLGRGFVIHSAYSHSDAYFAVRQKQYDVALVDVAMKSRETGAHTLSMLTEQTMHPPLIAVALNGGDPDDVPVDYMIGKLEEVEIQRVVREALRIPLVGGDPLRFDEHDTGLLTPDQTDDHATQQHIREIQTLVSLSKTMTESLNMNEVLTRVVEAARHLTDAEQGMILLPDDDAPDELWLRARVGLDVEVARNFRIRTTDMLAKTVYNEKTPLLIGAQGPQKIKTEFFVNSLLYVPIMLHGRPRGVLGVTNRVKHDVFTERHQELLLNLASFAAIAIENARIHEESVQQARELQALVHASTVINSSVELERTLPNICEQLDLALSINFVEIMKWERDRNQVRTLAQYHDYIRRTADDPTIILSDRPALNAALEHNEVILVIRDQMSVMGETDVMEHAGAGGLLVVPVYVTDRPFGAVQLFFTKPPDQNAIDAGMLGRVQMVALQLLTDLVNTDTGNLKATTLRLARELMRIVGADWCECAKLNADKQSMAVLVAAGQSMWVAPPYPSLNLDDFAILERALRTQTPVRYQANDTLAEPGVPALLQRTRARALLVIPLVNRGEAQGLVLLGDAERNRDFSDHEIDLARALSGQAAMALENSQLYHELQARLVELKDAQDRLIQTAKLSAMGELAAAVAHQINNPLTTIVLDTELMLLDEPPDSKRHDVLAAIVRQGKRAAEVVRRLLAAARPTNPDTPMEQVNVTAVVRDVFGLVKAYIERSQVKLTMTAPDVPIPSVWAVPGELDDVWLNLLLNAHDALHGRDDAEIGIDVKYMPGSKWIQVDVWDNGPGIPQDILDEIFKPFFTTKPVGQGTGLGLHICRQVVDRIGGEIRVESEPGQGTRFIVRLPVKEKSPAAVFIE